MQVDAFADRPFTGNPAAVCVLPEPADEAWMQRVAGEMNLSETAFLHAGADGYDLRWFTPTTEVDLCGHATLASAHVLWEEGHLDPTLEARFRTRSGILTARRAGRWIEMDFPAKPVVQGEPVDALARALGAEPEYVGRSHFDALVVVGSEREVRALTPDFTALLDIPVRGVIVTALSEEPGIDFVSRFFAPRVGVNEDPVTGSAHCCLAPYWAARTGRTELVGRQVSARGGVVRMRIAGDRVILAGQAVTTLRGVLLA